MAAQFLTEPKVNTGPQAASRGLRPVRLCRNGPYSAVLQLQRVFGNQRVARMIRGGNITAGGRISSTQRKPLPGAAKERHQRETGPAGDILTGDILNNADAPGAPRHPQASPPPPMEGYPAKAPALQGQLPQPRIALIPSGQTPNKQTSENPPRILMSFLVFIGPSLL